MDSKHHPAPAASTTRIVLLAVGACLIYAISAGIRGNYGVMLGAIADNSGLTASSVSFVLAIGQLVFGIMQPLFGIVAMKRSNRFVLCCGSLLTAGGLLLIPFCSSAWTLTVCLGIILPSGTGALSFGIIMGTVTPELPEGRVSTVSGLVNASSGIGNTILSPSIQALIAGGGLMGAMLFLSVPALLLLPVSVWMCKKKKAEAAPIVETKTAEQQSIRGLFSEAISSRNYRFLLIGFFTCGFHMAIIETQLFTQITSYNISEKVAAYAFSVYGIACIIGAIASGALCSRMPMQRLLGFIYGIRVVIIGCFLLAPKSIVSVFIFIIFLGLTAPATVTPTSGLVNRYFGAAKLATLFGCVFFTHQIGSFFSAWLGGASIASTGGYTLIWCVNAALCTLASIISFRISD